MGMEECLTGGFEFPSGCRSSPRVDVARESLTGSTSVRSNVFHGETDATTTVTCAGRGPVVDGRHTVSRDSNSTVLNIGEHFPVRASSN